MTRTLILCLALLLSGCATVGTKESFAVCKSADVVTTIAVLGKGGSEKNPLMGYFINRWGFAGLIGVSAAMIGLVYWLVDGHEDEPVAQASLAAANVITCGVAVHNAGVLRAIK